MTTLPTPRAYWCTVHDFPVFVGVKARLPTRSELIVLRTYIPTMRALLERGTDPRLPLSTQAHLRYLLHDLASPLELWHLRPGSSFEARAIESKRALDRAERLIRTHLIRISKGPLP